MNQPWILLLPILFPLLAGLLLLLCPLNHRGAVGFYSLFALAASGAAAVYCALQVRGQLVLLRLNPELRLLLRPDNVGRLLLLLVTAVWLLSAVYAVRYMTHQPDYRRFFGFYLAVYGVLVCLCFAGNLTTFYLCYEMMTLLTFPLVLHDRKRESVLAGLKYLFYSLCGAYCVLFGFFVLYAHSTTLDFTPGGVLDPEKIAGNEGLLLLAAFLMLLGFGVKAGMFPLHGWLSSAHPVAPAPASAVLSGIIVKIGALGALRVVCYLFGLEFLRNTWVQTTLLILSLVTVVMGSMLAFLERGFKRRLAYSTVSQFSYVLFGLYLMQPAAIYGALLHVVFHAVMKSCLFLCAGSVITHSGFTQVDQLRGAGKGMPWTMWCFTLCSLSLVGIPPLCGFVSKWYLCLGALDSGMAVFSWAGPVCLLVSALLTAGYLLPISIRAFFPGASYDYSCIKAKEASPAMLVPVVVLTVLAAALGLFPDSLAAVLAALS